MSGFFFKIIQLFFISQIMVLSGCGIFQQVFKSKEYTNLESWSKSKIDSTGLTVDRSLLIIKERVDTMISLPAKGFTQHVYLNMDSLVEGMTAIKNDLMDVRLALDPVTGILTTAVTLKPHNIPVAFERKIIKKNELIQRSLITNVKQTNDKMLAGKVEIKKDPVELKYYLICFTVLIIGSIYFWKRI